MSELAVADALRDHGPLAVWTEEGSREERLESGKPEVGPKPIADKAWVPETLAEAGSTARDSKGCSSGG